MGNKRGQERKKPKSAFHPLKSKTPRSRADQPNWRDLNPSFSFVLLEWGGRWSWSDCEDPKEVLRKLGDFEKSTWKVLLSDKKHHPLKVRKLCDDAKALVVNHRSFEDNIYSLRLSGERRIIGFRVGHVLKIVWWDQDHSFCPYNKKHT